ncbi:O-antigen ligase family protein [Patescibacteria group bacterium]
MFGIAFSLLLLVSAETRGLVADNDARLDSVDPRRTDGMGKCGKNPPRLAFGKPKRTDPLYKRGNERNKSISSPLERGEGCVFDLQSTKFWKKIFYFLILILHLVILFFTGTRGSYLGLIGAVIFALCLYIILAKSKKIKIFYIIFLAIFLASGLLMFKYREKNFIRNNHYLYRLTHISFKDATWNTRLLSWKAGWQGFKEKPILGIGSGNYAYFFDKYFNPSFYTFTSSETYFDHAHNNIVDITVTLGIFGIIAYLAIWIIVIYYLISLFREKNIGKNEFIILFSLLVAYFLQNLFVFDCLVTYLAFFMIISYIYYKYNSNYEKVEELTAKAEVKNSFSPILAVVLSCITVFLIWNYNIKPAIAMKKAVYGQYAIIKNSDLEVGYNLFEQGLSYGTVLDRDIRNSFINSVIQNAGRFVKNVPRDQLIEIVDSAISLAEKNLRLNSFDTMMNFQIGELYNIKAQLSGNSLYLSNGYNYLKKAFDLSPGRLQIHFALAQNRIIAGEYDKAIVILENAKQMNPKYSEVYVRLSKAYLFKGDTDRYYNLIYESMLAGYNIVDSAQLYKTIEYFKEKENYKFLVDLYNYLIISEPENANLFAKLAVAYSKIGMIEEAKDSVETAIKINPDLKKEAEAFLQQINTD